MKRIAILGSTGSIGTNTLKVIKAFSSQFKIFGLTANSNIDLLEIQSKEFRPKRIALLTSKKAEEFSKKAGIGNIKISSGIDGFVDIVTDKRVDLVVFATSGNSILIPLLEAIKAKKKIALANKEVLVSAGNLIMKEAKAHNVAIIPIDSEHSAILQCLNSNNKKFLNKIFLTSSGGPLLHISPSRFDGLRRSFILKHPRWKMGRKISVDSATLMNKGFEVIEAMHLFGVDYKRIEVLMHPQAIVHSMVEFIDGSILAQLSVTDMKLPIQYALSYPQRLPTPFSHLNLLNLSLDFNPPDLKKFPCLNIAYEVAKNGGSLGTVLAIADEELVKAYLDNKLELTQIARFLEVALEKHKKINDPTLSDILDLSYSTRILVRELIDKNR